MPLPDRVPDPRRSLPRRVRPAEQLVPAGPNEPVVPVADHELPGVHRGIRSFPGQRSARVGVLPVGSAASILPEKIKKSLPDGVRSVSMKLLFIRCTGWSISQVFIRTFARQFAFDLARCNCDWPSLS